MLCLATGGKTRHFSKITSFRPRYEQMLWLSGNWVLDLPVNSQITTLNSVTLRSPNKAYLFFFFHDEKCERQHNEIGHRLESKWRTPPPGGQILTT